MRFSNKLGYICLALILFHLSWVKPVRAQAVVHKEAIIKKTLSWKDYHEKTGIFIAEVYSFGIGGRFEDFYHDRFLEVLNLLPPAVQNAKNLDFNCDQDGRYFTINTVATNYLVDRDEKKILYQSSDHLIYVSPHGKYFALGMTDDGLYFDSVFEIPSLKEIVHKKKWFSIGHYVGDDRFILGSGVMDLENGGRITPVDPAADLPLDGNILQLSPSTFFGISHSLKKMVFWKAPSFKRVRTLNDLPLGSPFISSNQKVIGSFSVQEVYFDDLESGRVRGFALDTGHEDRIYELNGRTLAQWTDLKTGQSEKYDPNNEQQMKDAQKQTTFLWDRMEKRYLVREVFPEEAKGGFWAVFIKEGTWEIPASSSVVVYFDSSGSPQKIIHFPSVLGYPCKLNPQTNQIISVVDEKARVSKIPRPKSGGASTANNLQPTHEKMKFVEFDLN